MMKPAAFVLCAVMVAVATGLAPRPVLAQAAPAFTMPPVEDFTRRPKMGSLQYSADGTRFAVREEFRGRMNLVVGQVAGGALTRVTGYEREGDVGGFAWVGNDWLVFFLTDLKRGLAEQRGGGLFAVKADGSNSRRLAPTVDDCIALNQLCRYTALWSRVPGSDRELIVESNERSAKSPDLYRLDLESGRRTLLTSENPGQVRHWVLDREMQPRAAVSHDGKTLTNTFWLRDSGSAPWRRVMSSLEFEPGVTPLAFGPDGTLYVSSNRKSDTAAIYKWDLAKAEEGERIAFHPLVDLTLQPPSDGAIGGPVSPLIFDPQTRELIGIAVDADKPETYWLRAEEAQLQASIDRALPGADNSIRKLGDGRFAIRSRSDRDPGSYFIFDPVRRALQEVGRPYAWIDPTRMARVEVVRYKARDGMEIPGYLTLPAGKEAKNLPLVAWIHGGPWARDDWGWEADAQFLASRGYAVFQPNFRGSTGFGLKHLTSSFKKLGQEMQNDVTDGILNLVERGVVDRNRICIGGGSYGGYATMMGLVREPGLFKCGINVVGVTDLNWWLDLGYTDFNRWDADAATAWLTRTIGDPRADAEMMRANSPRLQAERIKAPVLFVHGGGDVRVPIKHAEGMRDAMKARDLPFEWVVYPEEGHGFIKESNRTDFYRRMEAFLARHLGPGR